MGQTRVSRRGWETVRLAVKHHSVSPAFSCQTKAISRNWDAQIQHLCSTVPTPPTPRLCGNTEVGPDGSDTNTTNHHFPGSSALP